MISVLALSAVDRGFEPRRGQTKDYKFGIYCFFDSIGTLKVNGIAVVSVEKSKFILKIDIETQCSIATESHNQ